MSWDWKETLASVAPGIATAIGGPGAGVAVKFLAGKLLGDEGADEDAISQAIQSMSPETAAELKKADIEFKKFCEQNELDWYKAENADRQSARDLAKAKGVENQAALTWLFVLGYFAVVVILAYMTGKVEEDSMNMAMFGALTTVLGVLTGGVTKVMNFWFGSSKGSQDKDQDRFDTKGK